MCVRESESECTYAIGRTAGQNGLDDDAGALRADDAEAEAAPVVEQLHHLYLSPVGCQLHSNRIKSNRFNTCL